MNDVEIRDRFTKLVLEEDYVDPSYMYCPESYSNYLRGVYICEQLKGNGLITFYADKINKPLNLHCLEVRWLPNIEMAELDGMQTRMVGELFWLFDSVIVETKEDLVWYFFIGIYSSGNGES